MYPIRIGYGYASDTSWIRIPGVSQKSDTYWLGYLYWIRLAAWDTAQYVKQTSRPARSVWPSIPSPQSAVTGALPWASTSGHPSLTRLSGWLDPAAGGRRAPSLAEFDRHEALNLLLHSNTLIWLLDFLCIIHPIAVTGGRLVQHLQRHH